MDHTHHYRLNLRWTGNLGPGTTTYRAYSRDGVASAPSAQTSLDLTADPAYRGDPARWNPEQLLVAALAQCHLLWYLHLAAQAGIVVTDYADSPEGTMPNEVSGTGAFSEVVLHPVVTITDPARIEQATALHQEAGSLCNIARSVNFEVRCLPTVLAGPTTV
ncbi:MAG: OsmC family protein [Microbacteriaceae bacterium]|jgi:organic hydroperoxide reductase OsmC/OhrA|nr:OsmC family protein [Microbacteriaceae bacterium]MCI1206948.1 OsmC family protein [Microbacteriaceae bacterium]